jgi:hypothetical protein
MFVCNKCHRHVRESLCPFCGATIDTSIQPRDKHMMPGVARTALLVGAIAAAGASLEACGTPVVTAADAYGVPGDGFVLPRPDAQPDAAEDVVTLADAYGVPARDVQSGDAEPDAAPDVVTGGDVYGVPADGGTNSDR